MNLTQIRAFVVLSECLNVTETAQRLFCTQPAVSIKIKNLEQSLNTVLFERINQRLYLTEQGKIFRQYALKMLQILETAQEHIQQFNDPHYGKITFGASHFVGAYLLPQLIADYKKIAPQVEIRMDILPSHQLIQRLENHEVEFLIMSDQVMFDPLEYHVEKILTDELILVASCEHPFTQKTGVCFEQALQEILVIKPLQSQTSKFLFHQLSQEQRQQLRILEINNLEGIKQCVIQNLGISFISRQAVANELALNLMKEIKVTDRQFIRGINCIYTKTRLLSPATTHFLKLLCHHGQHIG
ncbi:LysR family transcriptional regulator [Rodentibacter sp. Ppn85]|uniref:LysR family transcriptional regulator n=1 Tax=Rodentibacter sp. Ppn85 TaxID=1908525 RepID=UPI0009859136|nr:LysR family transcriptional regulator [Rodentibacter sp. Ppn85]OOF64737.1 LysR family transcriptional regulator [Rodentibacter sp. Ppn85]